MNAKVKGTFYGVVSAVCYGMNPLGGLFLYRDGVNTDSVLFYRFSIAALVLFGLLITEGESLRVKVRELGVLAVLGILFATSSLTLYSSFHHMDAGVASTLLFVYPVMVALLMSIFFREKLTAATVVSILMALSGVGLLYKGDGNMALSTVGVVLVLISSLSYALYIIVVNGASLRISSVKMTFYVLLFCIATIVVHSACGQGHSLQLLTTPRMWAFAVLLALVPTVISLVFMTKAVHAIGSTPTAIMGALEPLTAVIIGITVFGEIFTLRLAAGIALILAAFMIIIVGKSLSLRRIGMLFGHILQRL